MSYVELKHLLADLALEAMRRPAEAAWAAVADAYAGLASGEQPWVGTAECLTRAEVLAEPHGWRPSGADIAHLIERGLLSERDEAMTGGRTRTRDHLIALAVRFLPHLSYLQRHAPRLLSALEELHAAGSMPQARGEITTGAALFNAGLFFECHEWFEGLWKATDGPEKDFYHGIVQAAAAFYHYEKRNRHGSRTLMGKGRRRLAAYPARYLGVDLANFKDSLAHWAEHFEGGPQPDAYPRIESIHFGDRQGKVKGAPRG
jgi:hypothetical protein